jgi:hypothetical protein
MKKLTENGLVCWHANFEAINELSFFKNGIWRDWVLKGDLSKVERNYNSEFTTSKNIFNKEGLGFFRTNFLSITKTKNLISVLDKILLKKP